MCVNVTAGRGRDSVGRKTVKGGVQIGHEIVDFLFREFRVHAVVPTHNLFPEGGNVLDFRKRRNVKLGRVTPKTRAVQLFALRRVTRAERRAGARQRKRNGGT
jgi:hypothetical protein